MCIIKEMRKIVDCIILINLALFGTMGYISHIFVNLMLRSNLCFRNFTLCFIYYFHVGSKACSEEVINLKDVVKATVNGGLYRPMNDELGAFFIDRKFIIRNQTSDPNIRFKLPKNTSILKAIFPPVKLKLNSLSANMTYNKTHWIVMVTGELEICPGKN